MDVIVLLPLEPGRDVAPVPGSIVITADCEHRAWIAPASHAMYAATPDSFRLVCLNCS